MNIQQRTGTIIRKNLNHRKTSLTGGCFQELKQQIIERDEHICQICKRKLHNNRQKIVHHIFGDEKCFTKFLLICNRCNAVASKDWNKEKYEQVCLDILESHGHTEFKLVPLECCKFCDRLNM